MIPGNSFVLGSKGQRHESQKLLACIIVLLASSNEIKEVQLSPRLLAFSHTSNVPFHSTM